MRQQIPKRTKRLVTQKLRLPKCRFALIGKKVLNGVVIPGVYSKCDNVVVDLGAYAAFVFEV